jgi:hypothetical protein
MRHAATIVSQAILENGTSRILAGMPSALTPEVALEYLRELSADIRAAVLLDAGGRRLAGAEALAEPARELLAAAPEDSSIEVVTDRGAVFAARSERHALCVATGRFALPALVLYDLRAVLSDLQAEGRAA